MHEHKCKLFVVHKGNLFTCLLCSIFITHMKVIMIKKYKLKRNYEKTMY